MWNHEFIMLMWRLCVTFCHHPIIFMTDDKAGQAQSELSKGGMKRDVENTPKCTRPNCILA